MTYQVYRTGQGASIAPTPPIGRYSDCGQAFTCLPDTTEEGWRSYYQGGGQWWFPHLALSAAYETLALHGYTKETQ